DSLSADMTNLLGWPVQRSVQRQVKPARQANPRPQRKVFTIDRNHCSPSFGIGVHLRSEKVFTIDRNGCSASLGARKESIGATEGWPSRRDYQRWWRPGGRRAEESPAPTRSGPRATLGAGLVFLSPPPASTGLSLFASGAVAARPTAYDHSREGG